MSNNKQWKYTCKDFGCLDYKTQMIVQWLSLCRNKWRLIKRSLRTETMWNAPEDWKKDLNFSKNKNTKKVKQNSIDGCRVEKGGEIVN